MLSPSSFGRGPSRHVTGITDAISVLKEKNPLVQVVQLKFVASGLTGGRLPFQVEKIPNPNPHHSSKTKFTCAPEIDSFLSDRQHITTTG